MSNREIIFSDRLESRDKITGKEKIDENNENILVIEGKISLVLHFNSPNCHVRLNF